MSGLSIALFKPSFAPYTPMAEHLFDMPMPSEYQHSIDALGGFKDCSFSFATDTDGLNRWYDDALGAHVVVKDEGGVAVWEGRVNRVTMTYGALSVTRGPLQDVANRVSVIYQLLDTDSKPPEGQERKRTLVVNNTTSQDRFGICEQVLSAGTTTLVLANQVRDMHLQTYAWPQVPKQLSLGGGGSPTVRMECLGYASWMNYTYRQVATSSTTGLSTKLGLVLAADPNGFVAATNAQIAVNALAVPAFEDKDRSAWDIIAEMTGYGDAAHNRYLFGVYADREARYEIAPSEAVYQQRPDAPTQVVETITGETLQPWYILPGKWLTFTNLLPGDLASGPYNYAGVLDSARMMFIERVTYSAPYGLQLDSGSVYSVAQAMAQWGIGA
jgi:hypothetical protein